MLSLIRENAPEGAFDPETVDVLVVALEDAWNTIQASSAPVIRVDYAARAREILAKTIIEMATNGERNRRTLTEGALIGLARSRMPKSSGIAGV